MSGGSIVNAAAACAFDDYRTATPEEVSAFRERLVKELSRRAHMFRWWTIPLGATALLVGSLIPPFNTIENWVVATGPPVLQKPPITILINVVAWIGFLLLVFAGRSLYQERAMAHILGAVSGARNAGQLTISSLDKGDPLHTLCLTDMQFGAPAYFVGSQLITVDGHYATSSSPVLLTTAMVASAAFPFAFFPVRLGALRRLTTTESRPRRWITVTDGGVFNNLGYDWLLRKLDLAVLPVLHIRGRRQTREDQEVGYPGRFEGEGGTGPAIVIDCSALPPSRWVPGPRTEFLLAVWPLGYLSLEVDHLRRMGGILYSSGLYARQTLLQAISCGETSDIAYVHTSSPIDLLAPYRNSDSVDVAGRAREATQWLQDCAIDWDELARTTQGMPTRFGRVDLQSAQRVAQHGYYSVMAMLWTKFAIVPTGLSPGSTHASFPAPGS